VSRLNLKGIISRRVAVAGVCAITLSACGGGGGGGGGPAPFPTAPSALIVITGANAAAVADESADALLQTAGSDALLTATEISGPAPAPQVVTRVMHLSAERLAPLFTGASFVVTAAFESGSCADGGTVTVNTSSTSATITFNNCSDVPGEVVNGQVRLTGISGTTNGSAISFSANVSMDLNVAVVALPTLRTVGDFVLDFSDNGTGIVSIGFEGAGSRLAFDDGSHTLVMTNLNVSSFSNSGNETINVSFDLASTRLGGGVHVSTGTSLQLSFGDAKPSSGSIIARGSGSGLRLSVFGNENAMSPQAHIDLDLDGDSNYGGAGDGTSIDGDWADLDAA
jgi:hypothetical protein